MVMVVERERKRTNEKLHRDRFFSFLVEKEKYNVGGW